MQAQHIGGQLARKYGIPYRSSNVCAANTVDAQAAYESVFSLWGAINGGAHMLKHGGWLARRRALLLLREDDAGCGFIADGIDLYATGVSTTTADLALERHCRLWGQAVTFLVPNILKPDTVMPFMPPVLSDWAQLRKLARSWLTYYDY